MIAGAALLGLMGTAGEGTDILAHFFGFVTGGVLGVVMALPKVAARISALPQWMSGTLTLAMVAGACSLVLMSGVA